MKKDRRGFTLLEAVCALALLTLVFSGFTTLALAANRLNERTRLLDVAFGNSTRALASDSGAAETVTLYLGGDSYEVGVVVKESGGDYPLTSFASPGG